MSISTHKCEVVRIKLEQHPNADALSIVRPFGYQCCVRTEDWHDGDLAAYIPPDSIVPDTDQFAFLGNNKRIKVKRLRGEISMGLLVPAPPNSKEGDDVAGILGITHYEPPLKFNRGKVTDGSVVEFVEELPPSGYYPYYDIETLRRYPDIIEENENVVVTEKIHGCNGAWVYIDDRVWAKSRTQWKKERDDSPWWLALYEHPEITEFCKAHPGIAVYGEVYGAVQDLDYGLGKSKVKIAVFDLLNVKTGRWFDYDNVYYLAGKYNLPIVPEIYQGRYNYEKICELAEGETILGKGKHVREGVVVKTLFEHTHAAIGRVCLKLVGNGYYERG